MTRGHRTVHRLLWPALAVIVALGVTMALVLRPPPEQPEAPARAIGAGEMSVGFKAVQWNRQKIVYDAILLAGVALFIGTYMTVGALRNPPADMPAWIDLRINAFGTCAFVMLTIILMIGPLARLSPRFLPLLYNRRHFGVLTFFVALVHAVSVVDWFSAVGAMGDLVAEITNNPKYMQFIGFPMKALGLFGLTVMFLLAATSHDFWLAFLTPRVWKALHMALYVAYGVLVMHVALGVMQDDRRVLIPILLGGSFAAVTLLHIAAAWRERDRRGSARAARLDRGRPAANRSPTSAPASSSAPSGERIAVFRDGRQIGALTNLCAHQNGPLGEGRIIDGCVTCPWHGYQYRLEDGCAPPPFTEKLVTYRVRFEGGIVGGRPDAAAAGDKGRDHRSRRSENRRRILLHHRP